MMTNYTATTIQELEKLCQNKEVVAVGECGLDFNRNYSPQDVQKEWFDKQVALACHIQAKIGRASCRERV